MTVQPLPIGTAGIDDDFLSFLKILIYVPAICGLLLSCELFSVLSTSLKY
jgi:hypothetical protein